MPDKQITGALQLKNKMIKNIVNISPDKYP